MLWHHSNVNIHGRLFRLFLSSSMVTKKTADGLFKKFCPTVARLGPWGKDDDDGETTRPWLLGFIYDPPFYTILHFHRGGAETLSLSFSLVEEATEKEKPEML
ncbi:hypothetical protein TWF225_009088 [Orbilia oligospora]|uniref:Uncharacterized protein n=1 Tax=Orbilia oligospora TaxID=2813651 RepID=A0A7C8P3Q1_ORBOL|nr:hypothetical protein TWF751_001240 [Orbilia oligospora]KAF3174992.1 hypothetical protein TWF225_009088 [Orbilia oligospora]KAF3237294.1 hypothetical protein TWF217_002145 [Orbilia oligospora]KAF3237648.1 hypothetical protein TWF128_000822 [Orbilia oligospora]KAF3274810.1 hypothetical protein TWF132_003246 [Orbilia oligospora]